MIAILLFYFAIGEKAASISQCLNMKGMNRCSIIAIKLHVEHYL